MAMHMVEVQSLLPGDIILPPAREVSLWMRRHLAEHNLPETALYLTVSEVREDAPDKRGRWVSVKAFHNAAWTTQPGGPFPFKARPTTLWPRFSHEGA